MSSPRRRIELRRRRFAGSRPKLFYATQAGVAPPTFVFFASDAVCGSLQLSALPGEPAAGDIRLRWHADPARVPRPQLGEAAAPQESRSGGEGRIARPALSRLGRIGASGAGKATSGGGKRPVVTRPRGRGAARPPDARPARRRRRSRRVGHDARRPDRRDRAGDLVCHRRRRRRGSRRLAATKRACPASSCRRASSATADPAALADATDLVIFAIAVGAPARTVRSAARPYLAPEADVLSVVKGLERGTLLRMSEVIAEAAGIDAGAGSRPCPARTWPPRSPADCRHRRSSRPRTSRWPNGSRSRLGPPPRSGST